MTVSQSTLEKGLNGLGSAMRRRGMLQRADEQFPHAVGRTLLALATAVTNQTTATDPEEGCMSVSQSAVQ